MACTRFVITNVIVQDNTNVMQVRYEITSVNTISDRIAQARLDANLTQAQLARLAGVQQSTIGNIEAGLRKRPRELLAIAAALKVDPGWLQSGKPTSLPATAPQPVAASPEPPTLEDALHLVLSMLGTLPQARYVSVRAQLDQWIAEPDRRGEIEGELLALMEAPHGKHQSAA